MSKYTYILMQKGNPFRFPFTDKNSVIEWVVNKGFKVIEVKQSLSEKKEV